MPHKSTGQAPAISPQGGNAIPTVKPGTVVHNAKGQPIGTVVTLPNGKQGIKPIAVPGAIPQKPAGMKNTHQKPTIQLPVGAVVHGKNGAPIGKIGLANGKKVLQPLSIPSATPGQKPIVFPKKQTGQAPAISPHGGNAIPTVKPGTVVHNAKGQPIGTVVTLPNGKQGIKPIAVPGAIPQKPAGMKNPHQKPSIQLPVGTVVHGKNGAPIGKIGLANGKKVLQPLSIPSATPGQKPTVFPKKQTGQAPAISPHGGNAIPTVKPGTVVHNAKGQPIGTVVTLPNGKQGIKPIAVPGAIPQKPAGMKNTHQKPSIQLPVGTVVHGKNGAPIGTIAQLPNGTKVLKPIAVPGVIPQLTPGATLHNATPNAKPNAVPAMSPSKVPHNATPNKGSTPKTEKPGLLKRIENYFRGDEAKVIEPGIRNKEVEAYRTNDAKEIIYKDGIKQDNKKMSMPKDHTK